MNTLPTRDEIDDEYTWDLSAIFDSSDEWDTERETVQARLEALRDAEGSVLEDGESLRTALEGYESVVRRTQRLRQYAQLKRNEDTTDPVHEERLGALHRLETEVTKATDAIRREIGAADSDEVRALVEATPSLDPYRRFLEDVFRMAPHARSPAVEKVLADFAELAQSPGRVYTILTNNDIDAAPVEHPDGGTAEVTSVNYRNHLRHPDRSFRRRVYEALHDAHAGVEHAIARLYADKVRAHVAIADGRNFDSVREMAFNKPSYPDTGLRIDLPTEVHDTMLTAVSDRLDPLHAHLDRRREALGVDALRGWDLDVPVVDAPDPVVGYDEGRERVIEALEPLGEAYQDRLATFLEDRRIDCFETRRKQAIQGYAVSAYDTGPYLLMNYQSDLRSLSIAAHELGHAMHAEHLREANRPVYATGPRPIEEVPSYVNEFLLARHLMDAGDGALRQHAHERLVEQIAGGLYGAAMHSRFAHETYSVVENGGELTLDAIESSYVDLLSGFRAPMTVGDLERRSWLLAGHARLPYHSYQYVLGVTAALNVVDRLLTGEMAPDAYREFLRAGGHVRSVEALRDLGVDVRSRDPFDRAVDRFAELAEGLHGDGDGSGTAPEA
jgi:oligoendopeptidase F